MTPDKIQAIAQAYRNAPHEPLHESYAAFVAETWKQFRFLESVGYAFRLTREQPYKRTAHMFKDIEARNLAVWTGGCNLAPKHPLAGSFRDVPGIANPYNYWTPNEAFRAVHDVCGHWYSGAPFETFEGEMAAYRQHAKMYSKVAQLALYSETVGQLCHYYAGFGFVEPQKCAILPIVL